MPYPDYPGRMFGRKINSLQSILFATLLILILHPGSSAGRLRLVDNGYKGLVVAISNAVSDDRCSQVVLGLKELLQEFSKVLSSFTGGRLWLRDVTVILPNRWGRTESMACQLVTPVKASAVVPNVHVKITAPHPVFGHQPWTRQTQGCRNQGDEIQMSSEYLLSSRTSAFSRKAEILTEEWVKFRWGTFEENGFPGDPLYPEAYHEPYTNRVRANTCVNKRAEYAPVCPTAYHNPEAPTKQNAQCRGQPTWEIIRQSQDFKNGGNSPSNITAFLAPSVSYMTISAPQLVLVVEDTASMNLQERWEFVRKAVRHVMVYDVPDDVYVAVVVFNSVAKATAPLIEVDSYTDNRQRIGASLPRNPSTVPESQKCVLCGFQEAIKVLGNSPFGYIGGKVILVTTGNGFISNNEVAEIEELANLWKIRVDIIFYPLMEHRAFNTDATSLKSVVALTGGSSYSVMDEGVGKDSKVGMMVGLMNALFSTMRYSIPLLSNVESVLLHSESYQGGITSLAEGTFIMDDSFGSSFRFSVFYYDLSHVGNTVQLKSPTGETIDAINMKEDGDANIIYVNVLRAERGYWHYQVENRADSHQALHVQVTSSESTARKITLRVWSNSQSNVINMTDLTRPVIIYAELSNELAPILNAKVTGRLQRLGTNVSGSSYNYISFDLLDNGNGDPDITGDDGVYSHYLPSVYGNTGYYQLSITSDNNDGHARSPGVVDHTQQRPGKTDRDRVKCCGSTIAYKHLKPVAPFQRYLMFGVYDIMSLPSGIDILPPSRILDLISHFNITSFELKLSWTAPGDDYDLGRVHHYEAVLSDSWEEANDFDGEPINNMPLPKYSGRMQDMSMKIHRSEQIIYIAVCAIDETGNRGPVSNIASQWVPLASTEPPVVIVPVTLQPSTNKAQPLGSEVNVHERVENISLGHIAIIIGSAVGCLCVVFALATLYYCYVIRRRSRHKREDDKVCESTLNVNEDSPPLADVNSKSQSPTEAAANDAEQHMEQQLSPTPSCGAANSLQLHPCQMLLPGSPAVELVEPQSCFQICPDPFPDIVHMSNSSYQLAQVSPSVHSDVTPHRSPYGKETPFNYASPSHFQYPNPSSPYTTCMMPGFLPETSVSHPQEVQPQLIYQTNLACPSQITCTTANAFCSPVPSPLYGASPNVASPNHQGSAFCNTASFSYGPCTNNPAEIHGNTFCNQVSPLSYSACQNQASCSHHGSAFCSPAPPPLPYGSSSSSSPYSNHSSNPVRSPSSSHPFRPCANEAPGGGGQYTSMYTRISPPAPFKPSPEERVTTVSSTVAYGDKKCTEVTHL